MSKTKSMASSGIEIPLPLVAHARSAATYMIGLVADEIGKETDLVNPKLEPLFERFDAWRALIAALGSDSPVQVSESQRPMLLVALQDHTTAYRGVRDTLTSEGHDAEASTYAAEVRNLEGFVTSLSSGWVVA